MYPSSLPQMHPPSSSTAELLYFCCCWLLLCRCHLFTSLAPRLPSWIPPVLQGTETGPSTSSVRPSVQPSVGRAAAPHGPYSNLFFSQNGSSHHACLPALVITGRLASGCLASKEKEKGVAGKTLRHVTQGAVRYGGTVLLATSGLMRWPAAKHKRAGRQSNNRLSRIATLFFFF